MVTKNFRRMTKNVNLFLRSSKGPFEQQMVLVKDLVSHDHLFISRNVFEHVLYDLELIKSF